jgi:shikimate dehydrogenase
VLTRKAAVLGKPIAHSLSPVIHGAGYKMLGLNFSYTAIECDESGLQGVVEGLGEEWAGLSLTMPLKEVALTVADAASEVATAIGAANTLVRKEDGSWYAENTDVSGMVMALRETGVGTPRSMAILGAGGTARAALGAAARLGTKRVLLFARRREVMAELEPVAQALRISLSYLGWEGAERCAMHDVVISTVPKGVADGLKPAWRPGTVVFDVVYDPWPTPLAQGAQAKGCRIVSGLDLLLAQALVQFELFTGEPAPVAAMREALFEAAAKR